MTSASTPDLLSAAASLRLSPTQSDMWLEQARYSSIDMLTISVQYRMPVVLDEGRFLRAADEVLRTNESLFMRLHASDDGVPQASFDPAHAQTCQFVDLSGFPNPEDELARQMDAQAPGAMLAINLTEPEVAGPAQVVETFAHALEREGVRCKRLHVTLAAHSSLMEPMLADFRTAVAAVPRCLPEEGVRIVSNITGDFLPPERLADPDYWTEHLRRCVRFSDGLATLWAQSGLALLECGPSHTRCNLALRDGRRLAGPRGRRVSLPGHRFQRKRYWLDPVPTTPTTAPAPRARIADTQLDGPVAATTSPAGSTRANTAGETSVPGCVVRLREGDERLARLRPLGREDRITRLLELVRSGSMPGISRRDLERQLTVCQRNLANTWEWSPTPHAARSFYYKATQHSTLMARTSPGSRWRGEASTFCHARAPITR